MEIVNKYILVDNERIPNGTYKRDTDWEDEDNSYIVGINNWIINSKGEFLVQRRALTKKNNPGKWSSTNGLVGHDEESIDTVVRETKEELGIDISSSQILLVEKNHIAGKHLLVDIYITLADIDPSDLKVQESEVDKISFVSLEELLALENVSTTCSYIKDLAPGMIKLWGKSRSLK